MMGLVAVVVAIVILVFFGIGYAFGRAVPLIQTPRDRYPADLMSLALFGISSSGLEIFVDLLVLFLVLVYFALIYWVYLDAKRRLEDPVLIACATAAAFFPFVGPSSTRSCGPPEFLDDVHERDLEIRASELRVRQLIEQSCPHCEYPVELDYLRCPNCERKLKQPVPLLRQAARPEVGRLPVL